MANQQIFPQPIAKDAVWGSITGTLSGQTDLVSALAAKADTAHALDPTVSRPINTVFAAPSSGAAGAPTFRALVAADLPSGGAITLQTNAVNNGSQTKLNLNAGSNVTLTDDGTGDVTISSTGGSGSSSLASDTDVAIVAPADLDLLTYDAATSKWKNQPQLGTKIDKNGTLVAARRDINFIEGSNVTLTVADNPTSSRVDVTINAATGGGGGGSSPTRSTSVVTTASLAPFAIESDTFAIAKSFDLLIVNVGGKKCRVRLYSTAAARTADVSRGFTVSLPFGTQHGCIADFYFDQTAAVDPWVCSPAALGFNADAVPSTNIYASITNMDTVAQSITVTLTYVPMET